MQHRQGTVAEPCLWIGEEGGIHVFKSIDGTENGAHLL